MGLLRLFSNAAPNHVYFSMLMGVFAGISYSALIPLVMASITPADPLFPQQADIKQTFLGFEVSNYPMAGVYLTVCLLILLTRSLSEILLLHVGAKVASKIRVNFYERISKAPLSAVEQIGSAKLIAAINLDVPRIVMGARLIPAMFVNIITLFGMLGFLLYLNPDVFKLVLMSIAAGVVIYQLPMMLGRKIFERNREINDTLQESIRGLIYGSKELKLDKAKQQRYYEQVLLEHEQRLVRSESFGYTVTRSTVSLGDLLCFFVIGSITFIAVNYYSIGKDELVGVVMALLYITTPIAIVLNSIPSLTIASVSHRKVHKLLKGMPQEDAKDEVHAITPWSTMKLDSVKYHYDTGNGEKGFAIGPINLEIKRGEVMFIIGGNGSGKSTLSKLITQHYLPSSGQVLFDNERVSAENITSYRNEIYSIYSSFYLFDQLLIDIDQQTEALINQYLKDFRLDQKVSIQNGHFSTTQLSDGQRKRLALLVGFLDNKGLYLFDEWAADQDPDFKHIFYTKILPELKAKNKAVVVISHDDRYFYCADKVVKMNSGELHHLTKEEHLTFDVSQLNTPSKNKNPVVTL
ncbi:cyclic peptide export ABC transporter [Pseudoalteromonas sp. T1lg65]|uniref:cyclic peptide export ABC transporter n=1 Tax=Pseudoalteromonas sp. T1lg65 TaxID=2077101 RepID=UPI003F793D6B